MGSNIPCPLPGDDFHYDAAEGTSLAAGLISGLVSVLIARGSVTSVSDAKAALVHLAVSLKGTSWPSDVSGMSPVPRAALDIQVACQGSPDIQLEPFVPPYVDLGSQRLGYYLPKRQNVAALIQLVCPRTQRNDPFLLGPGADIEIAG
jgi:hypothetical protein